MINTFNRRALIGLAAGVSLLALSGAAFAQGKYKEAPTLADQVKAGKLRGLAVTSLKRSAAFPELPTVSEAGLPGFEVVAWAGVIAPAKTPKTVVDRLNAEINKALAGPAVGGKLAELGYEVVGGTPGRFAEHIRKESIKWADVVKRAGVRID